MERIFCISAGQLLVKKSNTLINKRNRYLNYGLLSLATILKQNGWNPIQIQGLFDSPKKTFEDCKKYGLSNKSRLPVLISIPSFYALSWVNDFISLIKELNSDIKIVIGGRWVVSGRIDLMKKYIPDADYIVDGIADEKISGIVQKLSGISPDPSPLSKNSSLDYQILHERNLYQPSIEISRGCGMGCFFCQEKDQPLSGLKSPKTIVSEAEDIILNDGMNKMNLYFESSMFVPNKKWIDELVLERNKLSAKFEWRTESRVDSLNVKHVEGLNEAGLRVIDLGLESASKTQLIKMGKTKNPDLYLNRASNLLKECFKFGIFVKINILLYAGETQKTIDETVSWLEEHKRYIKGVSVGPVIVFGWDSEVSGYIEKLENQGASRSHSPCVGVNHIDLSEDINYSKSIEISDEISKKFMSKEDYYYLKAFSYYSRNYAYEDFLVDMDSKV